MTTLLLSILFVGILIAGMAIGVILADKPIKGSCGGIAALGMGGDCDICGGDRNKCEEENKRVAAARENSTSDFYEVK